MDIDLARRILNGEKKAISLSGRKEKLTMPIALSHEVSNWANAFPIASRSSCPLTNQDLSQTDWPATKGLRYTKSRQKDEICQATQEEKDSEESSGTNV
ncbi:hypothetical protein PABG_12425 [Paracoccidioides brasiliensis Pb03]|nr:hypothetical protein PABG_12425 [Paracoccidioides brasiliensis Pb03]